MFLFVLHLCRLKKIVKLQIKRNTLEIRTKHERNMKFYEMSRKGAVARRQDLFATAFSFTFSFCEVQLVIKPIYSLTENSLDK